MWVRKSNKNGGAKARLQPWSLSNVIHVMIQLAMVIITIAFVYQHLPMNVSPISLKYVPKNRTHIAIGDKQLGWRPFKQNSRKAPRNQLIVPLANKGHTPNRVQEPGAESNGLLESAYAEIHYLRTMVARGRHSDIQLSGNTVKKRSRSKVRKVIEL